jgi:hypothetical protein
VLGTWTFAIVLALYAYYEHGPAGVGLAVAARMLPAVAFASLPALISRHWSRRIAVSASAIVRFLALEAVALVAWLGAPFAVLLALAAVFEIAGGVHRSARAGLVLESARTPGDLATLHSSGIVTYAGLLGGAVASAVIVLTVSLHAAFAFAGLAFLPVAAIAWRLPTGAGSPGGRHAAGDRPLRAPAIRTIAGRPWMRLRIALFGAAILVESTLDLLLVIVALELVHAGDAGVGWLRAAFACGGLLTTLAAAALLRSGRLAVGVVVGLALAGLPLALVAAWPATLPAIVMIGLLGSGFALLDCSLALLMRRLVAVEAAADAVRLEDQVYPLARAAGAGLATWLVLGLGDRTAVVVAGLLLPAVAIVAIAPLIRAERSITIPSRALQLLGELPLLAALPTSAMENLARCATPESFEPGTAIVDHDRMHVIDDGAVEYASEDGVTGRLGPGACFGDSAIIGDHRRRSTLTAVAPVTTWAITRADFLGSLGAPARRPDERPGATEASLTPTAAPAA